MGKAPKFKNRFLKNAPANAGPAAGKNFSKND
jgi:hypothetical protein